ncbi:MAG: hypothetical protein ACOYXB_06520 [Bacteroidota bacterium]
MKTIKMQIFSPLFSLIVILLFSFGCDKYSSEIPIGLDQWYISKVIGDSTGTTGKVISFDVYCPVPNDCNYITDFMVVTNGKTVNIKAFGALEEETICLTVPTVKVLSYEFKTWVKGQYSLNFISRDSSIIEHKVLIE